MILIYSLEWYILIQILAILGFILTFKLFKGLNDQGYCISKVLGITFSALISLLIMSYNFEAFEFTRVISYISVLILFILSIFSLMFLYKKDDLKELYHFIDKKYLFIIFIEIVFIIFIAGWAYIRAYTPDILLINKLLDFTYIKSILDSVSMPPDNLWLSGFKLNYYYFGYFLIANLMNLAPMSLDLSFNLMPGTILGILCITAGGLVYNLTGSHFYSILGGLLTAFISNYQGLNQILISGTENDYDWWSSAHFFKTGIFTEFPLWSATLGDLQSYFVAGPLILAVLYILIAAIKEKAFILFPSPTGKSAGFIFLLSLLIAFTIGTNLFTTLLLMLFLIILPLILIKNEVSIIKSVVYQAGTILIIILIVILIDLQFFMHYQVPVINAGISFRNNHTSFTEFFLAFGVFFNIIIIYLLCKLKHILKLGTSSFIILAIAFLSAFEILIVFQAQLNSIILSLFLIISLLIIIIFSIKHFIQNQNNQTTLTNIIYSGLFCAVLIVVYMFTNNEVLVLLITLTTFTGYLLYIENDLTKFITYGLLFIALVVLLLPEIIDIDMLTHNDIVTISLLYSQTLIIFPIIISILIYYSLLNLKPLQKDILVTLFVIILLPALVFTLIGPYYKSKKFKDEPGLIPNLSGTNHIMVFHDCDHLAIEWIKEYLAPKTIVLEAISDKHILSGRVSAYTGMTTILQSPNNIMFAYGDSFKDIIEERKKDIQTIYSTPDKRQVLNLLNKYNIEYIFVGEIEKELYSADSIAGFNKIGIVVNNSTTCKVYKLEGHSP